MKGRGLAPAQMLIKAIQILGAGNVFFYNNFFAGISVRDYSWLRLACASLVMFEEPW